MKFFATVVELIGECRVKDDEIPHPIVVEQWMGKERKIFLRSFDRKRVEFPCLSPNEFVFCRSIHDTVLDNPVSQR